MALRRIKKTKVSKGAFEDISELASKGVRYLEEKGTYFERLSFEPDEEPGQCRIAGSNDDRLGPEVRKLMTQKRPRLILLDIVLTEVTKGTEIYLPDLDVFGYVFELDEFEEKCVLEVTAVGMDEDGEEVSLQELVQTYSLEQMKLFWQKFDSTKKCSYLSYVLDKSTSWQVYKVNQVSHNFAADTEAIINPNLLSYRAALEIQKDLWKSYDAFCAEKIGRAHV